MGCRRVGKARPEKSSLGGGVLHAQGPRGGVGPRAPQQQSQDRTREEGEASTTI